MSVKSPLERLAFRRLRVRRKIHGTAVKPRLSVYRAQKHMYAQLVDDSAGRTLAAASSLLSDLKKSLKTGANIEAARKVGETIAEKAKGLNISGVVFDRGGRAYHGRIKAVADGARSAGLHF
ncbi:MAG: 50S ribosomal protein L18 [Elusimicrobia bacterium]|jgi:large subunit ribosomal protein L18|nr:50S ribosomal protein L18 [Elusimicrobiota bacterium]